MKDIYSKWGNYIPSDLRKQYENDCLEQDEQIKELTSQQTKDIESLVEYEQQIKELKDTIDKAKKHLETVFGSAISRSTVYRILNKH